MERIGWCGGDVRALLTLVSTMKVVAVTSCCMRNGVRDGEAVDGASAIVVQPACRARRTPRPIVEAPAPHRAPDVRGARVPVSSSTCHRGRGAAEAKSSGGRGGHAWYTRSSSMLGTRPHELLSSIMPGLEITMAPAPSGDAAQPLEHSEDHVAHDGGEAYFGERDEPSCT